MAGVTRFTGIAEAQTVGAADLDKLATGFHKLSESIDKSGKKAGETQSRFDRFAESVKTGIQNPLQAAGHAAESFLKSLGPIGAGLGIAAAGMGVLTKIGWDGAKALAAYGSSVDDLSLQLGTSKQEAAQFQFALRRVNADAGGFLTVIRQLSRGLSDYGTEGKAAREALKSLGIQARDSSGNLRPVPRILVEISAALKSTADVSRRNTLAMDLLGRSALQLLPDLLDLSEGLDRAKAIGWGPTDADLARFSRYEKQVGELEQQWEQFKRTMLEPAVGTVTFVLRTVTEGGAAGSPETAGWQGAASAGESGRQRNVQRMLEQAGAWIDLRGALRNRLPGFDWEDPLGVDARREGLESATSRSRGKAMQDRIRASWGATKEGIEEALKAAREDMATARAAVFEPDLRENEVVARNETLRKAQSEVARLEARLAALKSGILQISEDAILKANPAARRMAPSLYGPRGSGMGWTGSLMVRESDIASANAGMATAQAAQGAAFGAGLAARWKQDADRIREMAATELDHRVRIAELIAGPGGEVDAAKQILALRLAAAQTQEEAARAEMEYTERILSIRQRERQDFRSGVESAFDAAISGGSGGVRAFLRSQALGYGRTVAGNVGEMGFDALRRVMPNINSPLLRGLPFGPDPLKDAGVKLTDAGVQLQVAAQALMGVAAPGAGGGMLPSAAPGRTLAMLGIGGGAATPARYAGLYKALGIGGAIAGGAFGAYSGFSAGGAQGALTGTASLLGSAGALLPMLSKSLSFMGPVGLIAGMGLGLAASLLGDPKQKRREELEREAEARRYSPATGASYEFDIHGRRYDRDYLGTMRPIVHYYDQRQYSAIDAPSFVEWGKAHPEAIAEVNTHSITSGNGEDFVGTMRQTL